MLIGAVACEAPTTPQSPLTPSFSQIARVVYQASALIFSVGLHPAHRNAASCDYKLRLFRIILRVDE